MIELGELCSLKMDKHGGTVDEKSRYVLHVDYGCYIRGLF